MRVLHILSDSNVGGAGILLENLLRHTALPHCDITVLLPRRAAMAARLAAEGVCVLPVLQAADCSFSLGEVPRLLREVRRLSPDLLHTHGSLAGRVAGALCRVPIRLATRHCAYPAEGGALRHAVYRIADAALTTATVATAYAAVENLTALGIPADKIIMIRNGAEPLSPTSPEERAALRHRLAIPDGAFVVGMCARLAAVKGHRTLLEALAAPACRAMYALLVGGGEEEDALRRYATALGVAERVIFVGYAANPAPYVNLFDVALNGSVGTETSCLALSEAMSLGIPCVASRYGGNPEMVREGDNGLLFPPGDSAALAGALACLSRDPALRAALGAGARRRYADEFGAARMASAYDALYRRLFATREKNARPLPQT